MLVDCLTQVRLGAHGTVLQQDNLLVAEMQVGKSDKSERKYKSRRVFLFEQVVLITEQCANSLGHYYKYRSSIKVMRHRLGMSYTINHTIYTRRL